MVFYLKKNLNNSSFTKIIIISQNSLYLFAYTGIWKKTKIISRSFQGNKPPEKNFSLCKKNIIFKQFIIYLHINRRKKQNISGPFQGNKPPEKHFSLCKKNIIFKQFIIYIHIYRRRSTCTLPQICLPIRRSIWR